MSFRLSHLALLLAFTIAAAAAGGVVATWYVADREFRDVLDDDLEMQSEFVAELLAAERDRLDARDLEELLRDTFEPDDEDTRWVTVYDTASGLRISNLPHDLPLEDDDDGSLRLRFGGYDWQGYQSEEDGIVVQILRRDDLYIEVRDDILEDIVTPALVGGGINLLLLGLLIALFIWPLSRLARQLERREPASLEPLTLRTPAREITVLRDALNRMMAGVARVLERERQFTSDVAHELRNPLTTLKLELADTDPDLRAMKEEVDRLSRLVEQLLTLARLEQGEWRKRFEDVDLAAVLAPVIARFEGRVPAAGMSLEAELAPARVRGDPTLLEILLENLLGNALRHCPAGTRIEVRLEGAAGGATLRVSDTGPGIPADRRTDMGRRFSRLDAKSAGLGLGLAICRRIADAHGANLAFKTREDGSRGLVVEVTFDQASAR